MMRPAPPSDIGPCLKLTADCSDVGLLCCSIDLPLDNGSHLSPLWYASTPSHASIVPSGSMSSQHAVEGRGQFDSSRLPSEMLAGIRNCDLPIRSPFLPKPRT